MKVLNLQCQGGHGFEGWFGSEDEFRDQLARGLVQCPMCGDTQVAKLPSAPRLNLSIGRSAVAQQAPSAPAASEPAADSPELQRLKSAWWRAAREAVKNTEDVGARFAEEARRIHHGDAEERGIRGQATGAEVRQLLEEGVGIVPLPDALKETLQ